jgi:hypothetical protein
MKRLLFFLFLLATTTAVVAQREIVTDKLSVKNAIKLKGFRITDFSNDVLFGNASDLVIPTQLAVKTYVDAAVASGGGGGAVVGAEGILVNSSGINLGGTTGTAAPAITQRRFLNMSTLLSGLEFKAPSGGIGYVPLRFKSKDELDDNSGVLNNMRIEFEHTDDDNMNAKTNYVESKNNEFNVCSASNLSVNATAGNKIMLTSSGSGSNVSINSGVSSPSSLIVGKKSNGDNYIKMPDYNSSRDDAGVPSTVASFDSQGNLRIDPVSELKNNLNYLASQVAFTPIAGTSVNYPLNGSNVQSAMNELSQGVKTALGSTSTTMSFQIFKPAEDITGSAILTVIMPPHLIGRNASKAYIYVNTQSNGINLQLGMNGQTYSTTVGNPLNYNIVNLPTGMFTVSNNSVLSVVVLGKYGNGPWQGLSLIIVFD